MGATEVSPFTSIILLARFEGAQAENPPGSSTGFMRVPEGGRPSPVASAWKPVLAPDREYCVTLTLYGRNDQAMDVVRSNSVCAPVTNIDDRAHGDGCAVTGGAASTPLCPGIALVVAVRRHRPRR
jgi:hypothetical protein